MNNTYKLILYRLTLISIAKDPALKCKCGNPPYTDGIQCPKCSALAALSNAGDWPIKPHIPK